MESEKISLKKINYRDWEASKSTRLRFIKTGNILLFKIKNNTFGLAIVMSKVSLGHVVEILNTTLSKPKIEDKNIFNSKRLKSPVIIDSYGLIDKKIEGDWRVIGHIEGYQPSDYDGVYFQYGDENEIKVVNIFGDPVEVKFSEITNIPYFSPLGDDDIKNIYKDT